MLPVECPLDLQGLQNTSRGVHKTYRNPRSTRKGLPNNPRTPLRRIPPTDPLRAPGTPYGSPTDPSLGRPYGSLCPPVEPPSDTLYPPRISLRTRLTDPLRIPRWTPCGPL